MGKSMVWAKQSQNMVNEAAQKMKGSAEEHGDVAADVAQAIVTGVDILVVANAGQRDEYDNEGRLHEEPGVRGRGRGRGRGRFGVGLGLG